jgi:hypothetical protein
MWENNYMCQLSKAPSTDIYKFTSRIHLKSVSSVVLNYDEIRCGGVLFKRSISQQRKKTPL